MTCLSPNGNWGFALFLNDIKWKDDFSQDSNSFSSLRFFFSFFLLLPLPHFAPQIKPFTHRLLSLFLHIFRFLFCSFKKRRFKNSFKKHSFAKMHTESSLLIVSRLSSALRILIFCANFCKIEGSNFQFPCTSSEILFLTAYSISVQCSQHFVTYRYKYSEAESKEKHDV